MKAFNSSEEVPDYIQALEKPTYAIRNVATFSSVSDSKLESPTRVLLGPLADIIGEGR